MKKMRSVLIGSSPEGERQLNKAFEEIMKKEKKRIKMKEQVKELRIKIDGLAQLTKELKTIEYMDSTIPLEINSGEVNRSTNSLLLAKAWLGKVLGELGTETPYANDGKRKSVKDIEDTADVFPRKELKKRKQEVLNESSDITDKENLYNKKLLAEMFSFDTNWEKRSHIEKVDWLRQEIKKVNDEVWSLFKSKLSQGAFKSYPEINTYKVNIYSTECFTELSKARLWLGFELERVRENS